MSSTDLVELSPEETNGVNGLPSPLLNAQPVPPPVAAPNPVVMREMLANMKNTLASLNQTFGVLQSQRSQMATLGPSQHDAWKQIQTLRKHMHSQEKKQTEQIEDIKHMVSTTLKDEILNHIREEIGEQVQHEIVAQVPTQVTEQLKQHVPVSLDEHKESAERQLTELRTTLTNSEARLENSKLRTADITTPLQTIYRLDGSKSEHFPSDLNTLFAYKATKVKALLGDYGLEPSDNKQKNLNIFLGFIGITFQILAVPMGASVPSDGLSPGDEPGHTLYVLFVSVLLIVVAAVNAG